MTSCHKPSGLIYPQTIIHPGGSKSITGDIFQSLFFLRSKNKKRQPFQAEPFLFFVSHSRRYFFKIRDKYPEANFYLDQYHEIYQLNSESKGKPPDEVLKYREKMKYYFESMMTKAREEIPSYFKGNKYYQALNYFLENYVGLTLCLKDPDVPIDNNAQERLLRSHVVGRKTWYGTHSEQGAVTAAILFSIVETCKLNGVNPREYFKNLVEDLLAGKNPYTPNEYKGIAKI